MAMNFIRGEFFQQIADGSRIFYSHTHEVAKFLENPPKSQFVLITHNSDGKITKNPIHPNRTGKWSVVSTYTKRK